MALLVAVLLHIFQLQYQKDMEKLLQSNLQCLSVPELMLFAWPCSICLTIPFECVGGTTWRSNLLQFAQLWHSPHAHWRCIFSNVLFGNADHIMFTGTVISANDEYYGCWSENARQRVFQMTVRWLAVHWSAPPRCSAKKTSC